jgi:DNA-binding beta-propeller fold protein YncE
MAVVIYSWAGEKMPWLTVHMTLPLIFVAAHVIQTGLGQVNWRQIRQQGGTILAIALLLVVPALVALLSVRPFQSQSIQSINDTIQFIAALIVLAILGTVIWHYGRRLGQALAGRTAMATAILAMLLLTIRFSWLLSYVNYDYVNEMLVYAHASPDVKVVLNQIDDISRRTVGDKMIKIAYDNDSTWPLEWYMREYPNRVYYGDAPTREALDAPIVIVGSANEAKVKPFLGDKYTRFRYRLVWWPVEDYKDQSLAKLWQNYVSGPPAPDPALDTAEAQAARREVVRDNWRKLWKIIFYRQYEDYQLNEWPFVHRFFLYVRKDVATEIWDYQSGPLELVQASALDPYDGKRTELDAVKVWGSNGNAEGQFITPRNLAVGPDGTIYVADSGNHRIQAFDSDGNFLVSWGSEGANAGQFSEPWGLAVGPDGTVYVADTWNHRIQAFTATGQHLWSSGTFFNAQSNPTLEPGKFWGPRDIALDAAGNLYVSDTGNKRIQKFTARGEFVQMWGAGGIVPGSFEEPVGLAIDSQGNIYVADTWNRRIQKFDATFNPIAQWEVAGWESESVVNKPYLAVDSQDRLYVSDPEGYRIIVFSPEGQILVTWGQYGQDLASFALPLGLDFDQEGQLLVADSDNNRIIKFLIPDSALGSVPFEPE